MVYTVLMMNRKNIIEIVLISGGYSFTVGNQVGEDVFIKSITETNKPNDYGVFPVIYRVEQTDGVWFEIPYQAVLFTQGRNQ